MAIEAGRITSCPLLIISTNSSSKNSMWSLQDQWGPRRMAWDTLLGVHGGVWNLTGAPLLLNRDRSRRAGWFIACNVLMSPCPLRWRTKDSHPNLDNNNTSWAINSPSSCGSWSYAPKIERLAEAEAPWSKAEALWVGLTWKPV